MRLAPAIPISDRLDPLLNLPQDFVREVCQNVGCSVYILWIFSFIFLMPMDRTFRIRSPQTCEVDLGLGNFAVDRRYVWHAQWRCFDLYSLVADAINVEALSFPTINATVAGSFPCVVAAITVRIFLNRSLRLVTRVLDRVIRLGAASLFYDHCSIGLLREPIKQYLCGMLIFHSCELVSSIHQ